MWSRRDGPSGAPSPGRAPPYLPACETLASHTFGVAGHSLQRTLSEVHQPAHASNCAGRAPGIYGILDVKCCTMQFMSHESCAVHGGTTAFSTSWCKWETQSAGKDYAGPKCRKGVGQQAKTRHRTCQCALAVASRGTSHRQSSIAHEFLVKCVTPSPKAGGVKESLLEIL